MSSISSLSAGISSLPGLSWPKLSLFLFTLSSKCITDAEGNRTLGLVINETEGVAGNISEQICILVQQIYTFVWYEVYDILTLMFYYVMLMLMLNVLHYNIS